MQDEIIIQHRFTLEKDGIVLKDALVLPKEQYDALSEKEIELIKQERLDNFVNHIKNPPQLPEQSKEEILAEVEKELVLLEEKKVQLSSQKVSLVSAIATPVKEVIVKGGK